MSKQFVLGCFILLFSAGLLASPTTLTIDDSNKLPYWPSKNATIGGILLVHGKNSHGHRLFQSLATNMSKRGWSVAVVPDPLSSESFSEQLSSYLAKLRQQSKLKIGVLWYGDDYHQVMHYFSQPQAKQVSGLVLLSAYQFPNAEVEKPWQLRFPVLDIIAQFDNRTVKADSLSRQHLFNRNRYQKRTIPGAGPDYRYHETYLSAAIDNWLTQLPSPRVGRVF